MEFKIQHNYENVIVNHVNILKLYARIVNSTLKIIFGSLYSGKEKAIQKTKKTALN